MKTLPFPIVLLVTLTISARLSATIPIPDLVLFGELYDPLGTRIALTNSADARITVKLNDATAPDDPAVISTNLVSSNDQSVGDIYLLRIPREDGTVSTAENTAVGCNTEKLNGVGDSDLPQRGYVIVA